jgi:aspartokinase/homoserine dehydrogenase 1
VKGLKVTMTNLQWIVHKFGGTGVADAGRYKSVAQILQSQASGPKAVVVSAMAKVTDALIDLTERAVKRDDSYHAKSAELKKRHLDTCRALLKESEYNSLAQIIKRIFAISRTCCAPLL